MKQAAGLARDDLMGAGAAGAGLCTTGRAFSRGKGFAIVVQAFGLHPFTDLAVAIRAGILVIRVQMLRGRARTPIVAKAIKVMLPIFSEAAMPFGLGFFQSGHFP